MARRNRIIVRNEIDSDFLRRIDVSSLNISQLIFERTRKLTSTMSNILFVCFILQFTAVDAVPNYQRRWYPSFYNGMQPLYQQQQPIYDIGQQRFYSSNQQPAPYFRHWINNGPPLSIFLQNSFIVKQADQLSKWACGRSPVANAFSRIVGGQDAVPYSYPWMVLLIIRLPRLVEQCGGVLLTRRHVLTAAHCMEGVVDPQNVVVFAGIYYRTDNKNPALALTITIHPEYDPETDANDIAIVTLRSPLPDNDPRIGTICLPPINAGDNYPPPQWRAVAIGWGDTKVGGSLSSTLKQVILTILDTNIWQCKVQIKYPPGQICAGELAGGVDTCQGDSGGPLMIQNANDRWELVGITSIGDKCALPNKPGIYTRVSFYNDFIQSTIALSSHNPILSLLI